MHSEIDPDFWYNKKVFLTGHTGFKGSWLSFWLQTMGANVLGYSLEPPTSPNLFTAAKLFDDMPSITGDIRDFEKLKLFMVQFNPDIVIHMAAQPLVRLAYEQPIGTYATNVMGTVNLLESARKCTNTRALISVTSDKCYENQEWEWGYRENEPLGGHDPYSSSKGCAEIVTSAYRRSFFSDVNSAGVASVRAGNVIGGGDWAKDRLIPDAIRAFQKNRPLLVRNPAATRPWQHVLEPLCGYLILAEKLFKSGNVFAGGWNFGPHESDVTTVETVLNKLASKWGRGASWQVQSDTKFHEASLLKLDVSKAARSLGWFPRWTLDEALNSVVEWQSSWAGDENIRDCMSNQIKSYVSKNEIT